MRISKMNKMGVTLVMAPVSYTHLDVYKRQQCTSASSVTAYRGSSSLAGGRADGSRQEWN